MGHPYMLVPGRGRVTMEDGGEVISLRESTRGMEEREERALEMTTSERTTPTKRDKMKNSILWRRYWGCE
jgi:hypothetical protein